VEGRGTEVVVGAIERNAGVEGELLSHWEVERRREWTLDRSPLHTLHTIMGVITSVPY